jgi:DNA-binding MarR family transcriptional regulator
MDIIPGIQRATHLIRHHLETELADLGVDQAEAHVLAVLAAGPAPVASVVEAVGTRRSTLTNVLDRLEARGLARREINPADRRSFTVHPTLAGKRAARKVAAVFSGLDARVERCTTAREREAFRAVLARIEGLL